MIGLVEVEPRADLKRSVAFPERLNRHHPPCVPELVGEELRTLRRDAGPAFEYCEARCRVALKDDVPAGRVAGIVSHGCSDTRKRRRCSVKAL